MRRRGRLLDVLAMPVRNQLWSFAAVAAMLDEGSADRYDTRDVALLFLCDGDEETEGVDGVHDER